MADPKSEDLFEDTKMSFGAHIEELRIVLMRSLIGIGIGFALGLYLGPKVVVFLQEPLTTAIEDFQKNQAKDRIRKEFGFLDPRMNTMIERRRMIPRRLEVERPELARAISSSAGGELLSEEARLVGFELEQLGPDQTINVCKKFAEHDTAQLDYLWNLIDAEQQQLVTDIAGKDEASVEDQQATIKILNALLGNEGLYESEVFIDTIMQNRELASQQEVIVNANEKSKKPVENESAKEKEKRERGNYNEIRSLNMHLVAAAFTGSIAKPEMSMIPIVFWEKIASKTQSLGIQEPFMVWLKAGFFTGMAIASPWVFIQIWSFVATGLYPHEKNYVYLYMPFSLILFVGGAAFAFYIVFKYVLDFLFTFNAQMGIEPDPRIGEYLGFVLMLPIGFGFAFQLPLVMLFLHRIGLMSISMYLSKWRIAILVVCVISMIFTPTDPISMILMAVPLIGLYFFGILLCHWMPRGRNPFNEGYDPA